MNMKRLAIVALATLCVSACFHVRLGDRVMVKSQGPSVTRSYDFSGFDVIRTEGAYDVEFTQGDRWSIEVTTGENIHELLEIGVEKKVLRLGLKDRKTAVGDLRVAITAPDLRNIEVKGAADLDLRDLSLGHDFAISVDGAGDVEADKLICDRLEITVNGAGDIDISQLDASRLDITVNGAGDIELGGKAGDVDVTVNGTGEIDARKLTVSGSFNKRLNGVGSVRTK